MTNASDSTRPANQMPGPSNKTALLVWVVLLALLIPLFVFLARHPSGFLAVEKEQPSRCLIRARELAEEGRYDDALAVLKRGLKFYQEQLGKTGSPSHRMTVARIYHSMGLILHNHRRRPGDRERAEQRFRQGVEVDPAVGRGEGWFLLGDFERERDPVSALARYAGVVSAVSDRQAIRARGRSAEILAKLERWEEALKAYEDHIGFRSELDQETASAFVAIAERIGSTTGSILGRSYLRLNQTEKAKTQFQMAAGAGDPVARWHLSEVFGSTDFEVNGILFDPQRAFAASAGIDSVSFTWPTGCVVEFIAGKQSAGRSLVVILQPDRLRPQSVQLRMVLNDQDAGLIDIVRGDLTDYETSGVVRNGRNVLEIRCSTTWFEPDDRPVITVLGLKPGSRAGSG